MASPHCLPTSDGPSSPPPICGSLPAEHSRRSTALEPLQRSVERKINTKANHTVGLGGGDLAQHFAVGEVRDVHAEARLRRLLGGLQRRDARAQLRDEHANRVCLEALGPQLQECLVLVVVTLQ